MTGGICFIWGTRPEAVKVAPVMAELLKLGIEPLSVCSGQHSDLLDGMPMEADVVSSYSLGIGTSDVPVLYGKLRKTIENLEPDIVVVQGDTNTGFAAATAAKDCAKKSGRPLLAHLEAGIRSGDDREPWPEERNRRQIDRLADILYAPTQAAACNLTAEGIAIEDILVSGNTVVSALHRYSPPINVVDPANIVLVTLHRREIQTPTAALRLYDLVKKAAIATAFDGPQLRWPMHPGFRKCLGKLGAGDLYQGLKLLKPLGYTKFTTMLMWSKGVITDSGGVVEEAATLGVPTAILRRVNDRPEAVTAGIAKVFPPEDDNCVERAMDWLLTAKRGPRPCFGGPKAAEIVARDLVKRLKGH